MNQKVYKAAMDQAEKLGQLLIDLSDQRVVFAESCTCGLVAGLLASVPGISDYLCGSFVTYRDTAKTQWLGVSQASIDRFTSTSLEVSSEMALAALAKTPEATCSVAVTGHLSPPGNEDAKIYVSLNSTEMSEKNMGAGERAGVREAEFVLDESSRVGRQFEAATLVMKMLAEQLAHGGGDNRHPAVGTAEPQV